VASFDRALECEPNWTRWGEEYEGLSGWVWHELGVALGELCRYDEAVMSFQKALTIEPEDGAIWYDLARYLIRQGDGPGAVASLEQAIHWGGDSYLEKLATDREFDGLRGDRTFQGLLM
jgi:tetratricopeptide (TPR) repeat protein